jgi:hypothetical protein
LRQSYSTKSVWYCVFIQLTAKWPLSWETWGDIWSQICGVADESHLWHEGEGSGYPEAGIFSIDAASRGDAESVAVAIARKAMRRGVDRARILKISELKVVHEGRCSEMGLYPDFFPDLG